MIEELKEAVDSLSRNLNDYYGHPKGYQGFRPVMTRYLVVFYNKTKPWYRKMITEDEIWK